MAAPREIDLTVTLEHCWQQWKQHLAGKVAADLMSTDTTREYLRYARKLVDHLGGGRTCDSIEAADITAWMGTYRARSAGPATLRFCHKAAKGLLGYADSQRWLRENPMRDVAQPPPPRRATGTERAALTRSELEAMLAAARAGHGSPNQSPAAWARDEIVLRLAAESGLRNSELCNLDTADVQQDPGGHWQVQVRRGKGRKDRTVPITDVCAALIRDYVDRLRPEPAGRPDRPDKHGKVLRGDRGALLLNEQRHRIRQPFVGRMVRNCAHVALGRRYVPHGLRHTAGTLLAREARADLAIVAHVLGHADVSVTSVYLDTRSDEAAAAVNRRKPGSSPKKTRALPPGPDTPTWEECGTRSGWQRHRREKIPVCGPCRLWRRGADRERRLLRELMPQRLHGTETGWRDWKCRCDDCRTAHFAPPEPKTPPRSESAVDSVKASAAVPRPTVSLVKKPRPRPAVRCGTTAGYKLHRKLGEQQCRPCLDAVAAYSRERAAAGEDRRTGERVRPRAVCPVCGELRALTAAGMVRRHPPRPAEPCSGSGCSPAADSPPPADVPEAPSTNVGQPDPSERETDELAALEALYALPAHTDRKTPR